MMLRCPGSIAIVTVWLQSNPPSFDIVDIDVVPGAHKRATLRLPLEAVPPELLDSIVSIDVPKEPLKAHLEATGEIPPGVEYQNTKRHLRVRSV